MRNAKAQAPNSAAVSTSQPAAGSSAVPAPTPDTRHSARLARLWAWLPVLLLLLAILVLWALRCRTAFDSPYLLAGLSFVFLTLSGVVVVSLVARSFLVRAQPGLLLLSCGILLIAASGVLAPVVGKRDINLNVTIYNLCAWLAAACHLLGVVLLLRPRRTLPGPGLWLWLTGLLLVATLALVVVVAQQGWTPLFFIQGQGGTPLRQFVLGSAITLFALAALLPVAASRQPLAPFLSWYSPAVALIGLGHFGLMLDASFGSPVFWVSRAALYLAGVYFFLAALASLRESHAWGLTLEMALHQSEERFRALTQASFEGIVILENGRITDCNEQYLQMLGYRREELLGLSVEAVIAPEDRARILTNVGQGRETCAENGMLRKDGTRLIVEAHGKPLEYRGRQVRVAAIRDITERKRMEQALRESQERLYSMFERHQAVMLVIEPRTGAIVSANPAAVTFYGYSQEQLTRMRIQEINQLPAEEVSAVRRDIVEDRRHHFIFPHRLADGQIRWVEVYSSSFQSGSQPMLFSIIQDITARKQAEAALEQAQAQLQQHAAELEQTVARRTAKLHEAIAELEHFSYAITHDMRAPLRAMQGYAEILDTQCGGCPQPLNREFFRRIKIASSRMDQLITDSLNYSKAVRQEVALEPVNLRELLQGLIETYPNLLPDKADIRLESALPIVMGNQAALTQCFGNLLGNAVKFARPNLKPQIRIWAEPVHSPQSTVHSPSPAWTNVQGLDSRTTHHASHSVRIWVEDNGIGIAKEVQERIFGLFERGSNEQEGTGLGLAIVRKLARRMGGEAGVESEPGQGSRFWVELALAPTEPTLKALKR